MKTMTGIDLFVQALLIFGLLGSGAVTVFYQEYTLLFLLFAFITGIWQLGSALVGSFYYLDKYKSIFLASSIIYCSFLVFLSKPHSFIFNEEYNRIALITFLGVIPVFASMIYFYLCVTAFNRRLEAKKEETFV